MRKERQERWAFRDFLVFLEASGQMVKMVTQAHLARTDQLACAACRATLVPLASVEPPVLPVQLAPSACEVRQVKKVLSVPLAHRVHVAIRAHRVQQVMPVLSDPGVLLVSQVRMVRMVWMVSLAPKESVATSACRVCVASLALQGHKASKVRRERRVAMAHVDSRVFKAPRVRLVLSEQEGPLAVVIPAHKVRKVSKAPKATRDPLVPELEAPLDLLAVKVREASLARMDQRVILAHQAHKGHLARMV